MLLWCCCRSSSFAPTSSAFLGGKLGTSAARRARPSTSHAASPSAVAAPSMKSRGRGKRAKVKRVWRRSSLHAAEFKDKLGHGVWDKFKVPPDGRAHDEVTFRSGCEGRTLTIPQGVVAVCTCRLSCLLFSSSGSEEQMLCSTKGHFCFALSSLKTHGCFQNAALLCLSSSSIRCPVFVGVKASNLCRGFLLSGDGG